MIRTKNFLADFQRALTQGLRVLEMNSSILQRYFLVRQALLPCISLSFHTRLLGCWGWRQLQGGSLQEFSPWWPRRRWASSRPPCTCSGPCTRGRGCSAWWPRQDGRVRKSFQGPPRLACTKVQQLHTYIEDQYCDQQMVKNKPTCPDWHIGSPGYEGFSILLESRNPHWPTWEWSLILLMVVSGAGTCTFDLIIASTTLPNLMRIVSSPGLLASLLSTLTVFNFLLEQFCHGVLARLEMTNESKGYGGNSKVPTRAAIPWNLSSKRASGWLVSPFSLWYWRKVS